MTPDRWQQVKEIFNSAIKYQPDERSLFLSQHCSGDEDLRVEVESLIKSYEKSGEFIDEPAFANNSQFLKAEKTELLPGQAIGSYEVVSFLNRGGMGEVYVAQDRRLNRKVALKLLPEAFTSDAARLRRFEQEARAASALNHPNIITIYEICEAKSTLMIATEFVEGETLRDRLARGPLELKDALDIAIQVADALTAAHSAGIIHRDIKPENIMIRPDGYVKVLDFGLAKLAEQPALLDHEASTKNLTGAGVIMGTVGYMSPEQARGLAVDARSDIFNLGTVLYEMVAGHKAFEGKTPSDALAAILKIDPPLVSQFVPDAAPELVRIINKSLRKDPEERYQVVKDLLLDLKSLRDELAVQAVIKRHKTRSAIAIAAIAVLAIVGIAVVYKFFIRRPQVNIELAPVANTIQITFSAGLDGFPSFSPDGKSIVYSSDQNGSFDLYVKQIKTGGGELQLTNDGQQNFHPSWSPDGQRVAYHSKKRGGIWVVSALGGTPKQLTEFGCRPAWSPDGSQIAFQSGTSSELFSTKTMPPSTIYVISAEGGKPKQITHPGDPTGGHAMPTWSPDGKRIAFAASDYLSSSVWIVNVDGSDQRRIADGAEPAFASDGGLYLLGTRGLEKVSVNSTGQIITQVIVGHGSAPDLSNIAVSADGKRIAYAGRRVESNLWTVSVSPATGDATGPAGPFSRDTSLRNNLVRFSPDGKRVALNRWRPGTSADLWLADVDGKNLTQITNNPATDSQANWFPEGDKIAFLSDRNSDHMSLWTISLATGKEEPLIDLGEGVEFAQLSPDAKQVAFNFTHNGAMNIWVASTKDGTRRQLTFDNAAMGFPCWSRDGKQIAFESLRGEDAYLFVIPSAGGQPTQLIFDRGKSWPNDWSPNDDKVIFAGQRDGIWNLYWISLSTKVQKQITDNRKRNVFVRYPAWAPSGNQIIYEYAEITGNIWLMELKK